MFSLFIFFERPGFKCDDQTGGYTLPGYIICLLKRSVEKNRIQIRNINNFTDTKVRVGGPANYKSEKHFKTWQIVELELDNSSYPGMHFEEALAWFECTRHSNCRNSVLFVNKDN